MDEWQKNFLQGSPMFEPLRGVGATIEKLDRWPTLDELNALLSPALRSASGAAIRFVPQGSKPSRMEEKYEARIYLAGEVQTRTENWHDLFNALVWLAFPLTKAALNAQHFAAISQGGEGNRGAIQDVLTLFDESGVIVAYADDDLACMLREHQWSELFWEQRRTVVERMHFVIFGHSLFEKALKPYVGFTGKGLPVKMEENFFTWPETLRRERLDHELSKSVFEDPEKFSSLKLTPAPLLGIPGWWQPNENKAFYSDTHYFRPKKS